jgi:phosphomethylpyrimidine synthase
MCKGASFYVLGPLVTDIALGYDHIVSAIGGAVAAYCGADLLCYVTPAEHLKLLTAQEVAQGVIAARIAVHAADLARGLKSAHAWDLKMAQARKAQDWETQMKQAIDPATARAIHGAGRPQNEAGCTMCGKYCAIKLVQDFLGGDSDSWKETTENGSAS